MGHIWENRKIESEWICFNFFVESRWVYILGFVESRWVSFWWLRPSTCTQIWTKCPPRGRGAQQYYYTWEGGFLLNINIKDLFKFRGAAGLSPWDTPLDILAVVLKRLKLVSWGVKILPLLCLNWDINHGKEELGRSSCKPLPHPTQVQWVLCNRRWRWL